MNRVSTRRWQDQTSTLALAPTDSRQIAITLDNIGNTAQMCSLHLELPSGLAASGIPSALSLAPSQSTTLNLSLTSQGLVLNSEHVIKLIATFGANGQSQAELSLTVHIAAPSALTAFNAANAATEIGRPNLGATLKFWAKPSPRYRKIPPAKLLAAAPSAC